MFCAGTVIALLQKILNPSIMLSLHSGALEELGAPTVVVVVEVVVVVFM